MGPVSDSRLTNMVRLSQEKAARLCRGLLLSEHFVLYLSVAYFLVLLSFYPRMAGGRNLGEVSSNMWPLLALAIGQTFVLIVAGIDLSQTAVMAVTSVIGGALMSNQMDPAKFGHNPLWNIVFTPDGGPLGGSPWAVPAAVLVMLFVGTLIGLLNGTAVAKLRMPPFIVTLVSMMFFNGLAIYITRSENIMHLPNSYIAIGKGGIGFVPYSFFVAMVLAATAHAILTRTVWGRWFYAVGQNVRASVISGVPTERVVILAYMFSGFCAAVGSILYSARLEGGRPTLGQDLLLDIIGACVIGGISLFGGKGKILWTLFGVLFFTLLSNSLGWMNLSFYTVNIVKGTVILLAAFLDVTRTRFLAGYAG